MTHYLKKCEFVKKYLILQEETNNNIKLFQIVKRAELQIFYDLKQVQLKQIFFSDFSIDQQNILLICFELIY